MTKRITRHDEPPNKAALVAATRYQSNTSRRGSTHQKMYPRSQRYAIERYAIGVLKSDIVCVVSRQHQVVFWYCSSMRDRKGISPQRGMVSREERLSEAKRNQYQIRSMRRRDREKYMNLLSPRQNNMRGIARRGETINSSSVGENISSEVSPAQEVFFIEERHQYHHRNQKNIIVRLDNTYKSQKDIVSTA